MRDTPDRRRLRATPVWPRRRALRAAAAVAAGAASAGLAGCGSTAARLLQAASRPIVLVWRPWSDFPNGRTPTTAELMHQGIAPWLRRNPGVEVRVTTVADSSSQAALLAGSGPDVFEDRVLPPYIAGSLLLDLAPFARRDGVSLAAFPSSAIDYIVQTGAAAPAGPGLYGLPAYSHTVALAVNRGLLDDAGLPHPEPGWTYLRWTQLWESATRRSAAVAAQRFGGQLYWSGYDYFSGNPAPFYLRGFGGEYVDPADRTRCALQSEGSVRCLEWAYGLLRDGVVGGDDGQDFTVGRQVTAVIGTAGTLPQVAESWRNLDWDLYAMPVWPRGPMTFASSDFYGVSATTAQPEIAWDFLKYLCADSSWQRFMMQLALVGPNQPSLFPEWAAVVAASAPPLRRKNLGVILDAVAHGHPYVGASFRYQEEASAAVISQYTALAQSGRMSIAAATARAASQVDGLQAQGPAVLQREVAQAAAIVRAATAVEPVRLPDPEAAAAVSAPRALVAGPGRATLSGAGSGVGGSSDHLVFAAVQADWSAEAVTCRLLSIQPARGTAGAGVMMRGGLDPEAALFALEVATDGAAKVRWRTVAGALAGEAPIPAKSASTHPTIAGEISAGGLSRPLWLRLVRSGVHWQALLSRDGASWAPAGPRMLIAMGGAWAGVYAYGTGARATAAFDRAPAGMRAWTIGGGPPPR